MAVLKPRKNLCSLFPGFRRVFLCKENDCELSRQEPQGHILVEYNIFSDHSTCQKIDFSECVLSLVHKTDAFNYFFIKEQYKGNSFYIYKHRTYNCPQPLTEVMLRESQGVKLSVCTSSCETDKLGLCEVSV